MEQTADESDCNDCSARVRQLEAAVGELRGQLEAARRDSGQRLLRLEQSHCGGRPRQPNGSVTQTKQHRPSPSGNTDHHTPHKKARPASPTHGASPGFSSFPTTSTSESQGVSGHSSNSAPTETSQYYFSSIMSSSVDSTTDRDGQAQPSDVTEEEEKSADASAADDVKAN